MPRDIKKVAGLPVLLAAMRPHGYCDAPRHQPAQGNRLALLDRTWGA